MATLQQTVDRWKAAGPTAQSRWIEGIQSVTSDPMQAAVANQAGLLQGFNAAVQSGLWARRTLAAAGTWKQTTIDKQANFGTGIAAGASKFQSAMQTWLPITQQIAAQVKATPALDINARLARATAFGLAMHNAKLQQ